MRSDKSANGTVSGRERRMMSGMLHDSNCAARIRYMKTNDIENASRKPIASSEDVFDRPVGSRRYSGGACAASKADLTALTTSLSPKPGATLAMNVTCRCRPMRLICDGPEPDFVVMTDVMGTVPCFFDATVS